MSKSPEIQATLEELVNAVPFLARVLSVKTDATLRYHVLKLTRLVEVETKIFNDEQQAMFKELGYEREPTGAERAKFGPGKRSQIKPEHMPVYLDKVKDLLAVKVVIPWGPLTNAAIEKYEDITGEVCIGLGPLFELDPAEDKAQAA